MCVAQRWVVYSKGLARMKYLCGSRMVDAALHLLFGCVIASAFSNGMDVSQLQRVQQPISCVNDTEVRSSSEGCLCPHKFAFERQIMTMSICEYALFIYLILSFVCSHPINSSISFQVHRLESKRARDILQCLKRYIHLTHFLPVNLHNMPNCIR